MAESKEGKKALAGKAGLVSKAAASAGVQKVSRTSSTRSILGTKDNNKRAASTELKRPASGSGVMGAALKKRHTGSSGSQLSTKEEKVASENEPPKNKTHKTVVTEVERIVETKKEEILEYEPKQEEAEVKTAFEQGVADLDEEDYDDPLMVAEYVGEIF